MLNWFRRIFQTADEVGLRRIYETVDALNAAVGGGEPVPEEKFLGHLKLRSGTLVLGDCQWPSALEVPNIGAAQVAVSAKLWRYPSGTETVTALMLRFGDDANCNVRRKIGEVGIDSATLVVADQADIRDHWTEVGLARIGVIQTLRNDALLRVLTKRFKLTAVRINNVRAEVVGPVSEQLEREIEDFLKSKPEYADYPFMHFRVQTSSSFDRANYMKNAWEFMPVGNQTAPLMFVCKTGRGDAVYDVECNLVRRAPGVGNRIH